HVVIALELGEADRHTSLVEQIALASRSVDIVSPIRGLPVATASVTHFFSHDVLALRLHNNLASAWNRGVKRAFDLVMASILLVVLLPLFAWIALRVRDTGRGVVFGHRRIGRRGEPFTCYKFRTMVPDAEEKLRELLERDPDRRREWEERHKLESDPRITPIGRFLRQTSLDELPQLWNVLRGDMSLVGPRPVVSEELARYGDNLPYYFECTPGLTGLWQISGRNDVDYRRRVHLDCWYVKNWSLWYDLVILLKTIPIVVLGRGAY
ncbi:MAG TPA: exopolysaccharide biosynthesis polyprenyl glycosylphosphotransferase, partial [Geminicoccus sp.]|uniref:exopolysaccharide biosynthesis polyprenyl glycosylphosphotransferase n=1 Tax=Geminicoccus sp. TaxID=2024832 RepID=UPI002C13C9BE